MRGRFWRRRAPVTITPVAVKSLEQQALQALHRMRSAWMSARTGRLKFSYTAGAYIFSSAALAGELAYFGSHNGRLYAVNAKSGQLAWQFQTEGSKRDPLKLLNEDGSLNREAMTPTFGDFQDMYVDFYRFASVGAIMGSPAVDRGVVYIGSMDGNLYALQ